MNKPIKKHLSGLEYRAVGFVLGLSLLLNILLWFIALKLFPHDRAASILHYSTDLGIDFIGEGSNITALPRIGLFLLLFNILLGFVVLGIERRAAWLLWLTTPWLQLILLGAIYFLWKINPPVPI